MISPDKARSGLRKNIFSVNDDKAKHSTLKKSETVSTHLAAQLLNETEEKKEEIMNESINCIFNRLPQTIMKLDELLNDFDRFAERIFADASQPTLRADNISPIYKFALDNSEVIFPPSSVSAASAPLDFSTLKDLDNEKPEQRLQNTCARHLLDASHMCSNNYDFTNTIHLLPCGTVSTNVDLNQFTDRLRPIFIELSQYFLHINLGLSLMFPRTEDNEECNLSLEVLNKLINLATLEYSDFFETNSKDRANLVDTICSYPHFGESRRMLIVFDRNACIEFRTEVQSLIKKCSRLYDSLIKNFDMVLKAKKRCANQPRDRDERKASSMNNNESSSIRDSFYS